MVATVICVLLLFFGWIEWSKGNKAWGLVLCAFFLTDFFSLAFFHQVPIKAYDFCIVFCTVLMVYENLKNPFYFTLRNDPVAKTVIVLEIYLLTNFLVTCLTGTESWVYAIKTYRYQLFFLLYFLFRNVPTMEYIRSFKILIYISFVLGILFYLQLLGVDLLQNNLDIRFGSGVLEYQRLRNIPDTTIMVIVSALFLSNRNKYLFFTLLFWGGVVVLSQHRGMMLSLLLALPLGLYLKGCRDRVLRLSMMIFTVCLLFSPVIIYRFSEKSRDISVLKDIRSGLSGEGLGKEKIKGTFSFRIALAFERLDYMAKNPKRFLYGIGVRHEDSPATKEELHFKLGSIKKEAGKKYGIRQQIDTVDIAFISFFLRYGFIGIGILFYLLYLFFSQYIKGKDIAAGIGITLLLYAFFRVLSGDEFTPFFYCLLFVCSIITRMVTSSLNISIYENSGRSRNIQQADSTEKSY